MEPKSTKNRIKFKNSILKIVAPVLARHSFYFVEGSQWWFRRDVGNSYQKVMISRFIVYRTYNRPQVR